MVDRQFTVSIYANYCHLNYHVLVMAYSAFYYFTKVTIKSLTIVDFYFSAEYYRFHSDTALLQLQFSHVIDILAIDRDDRLLRRLHLRLSYIFGGENRLKSITYTRNQRMCASFGFIFNTNILF